MRLIAVEGMDGIGKAAICAELAEKLGYVYADKALRFLLDGEEGYANYYRIADAVNNVNNKLFRAWFYALSDIYLHAIYDGGVVTDKYFLSNYAFNGTDAIEDVFNLEIKKLGNPYLTVILYATESYMFKHLSENLSGESEEVIKGKVKWWQYKYEKMVYLCEKHGMRYVVINVDETTAAEDVVQTICDHVRD